LAQLFLESKNTSSAHDRASKELSQLREDGSRLQANVAQQEAELTRLRSVARESTAAHNRASKELETLRHEFSKLQAALSESETELAHLRNETKESAAAHVNDESELRQLRSECTKLQSLAAKREKKLEQTRVVADDAIATRAEKHKELRRLRKDFSRMETRLSKREAQLDQTRAALADVVAGRDQRIEEIRQLAHGRSSDQNDDSDQEYSLLGDSQSQQRVEPRRNKLIEDESYDPGGNDLPDTGIVLRTNKSWSEDTQPRRIAPDYKKFLQNRNVLVAAALAASLIIFVPVVVFLIPSGQQASITIEPGSTTVETASTPEADSE